MERVLVTGGAGFIGSHLVDRLRDEGYKVNILDLNQYDSDKSFEGSVTDREAVEEAAEGCDAVFHFASVVGVGDSKDAKRRTMDVNVMGLRNVLEVCKDQAIDRVFFPSSSEVYGDADYAPFDEQDPPQPVSVYGSAKLLCEKYLEAYQEEYGIDYNIVRYFNVYGPRQRDSFVLPIFVKRAVKGQDLQVYGEGDQVRAFCHVDDAVDESIRIFEDGSVGNEVFNVGNDERPITIYELAEEVCEVVGSGSQIEKVPFDDSDRTEEREIFRRIPDISKARERTGYQPGVSLTEGIKDLADYWRAEVEDAV